MATSAQKRAELKFKNGLDIQIESLTEQFGALNDFIIVKPLEIPVSDKIQQPDQYKENPWAIVIAVGQGRVLNGVLVPIEVKPGDKVYITKYGEDITLAGVKCQLIHAAEVKIHDRMPNG